MPRVLSKSHSLQCMVPQVEVQRRETERQAQLRTRSYTFHREQVAAEAPHAMKSHSLPSGNKMLVTVLRAFVQKHPGNVAMGLPAGEYLKYVSPVTWAQRRTGYELCSSPHQARYLKVSHSPDILGLRK
jgi:hypothetical protein